MAQTIQNNLLTSVEEKCLPFGRQALMFTNDFNVTPSLPLNGQSLGGSKQFSGPRGVFLNATAKNQQVVQGGQVKDNFSYFHNSISGERFLAWTNLYGDYILGLDNSLGIITLGAFPTGYTNTSIINKDFYGGSDPFVFDTAGNAYTLVNNATNIMLIQANVYSGDILQTLALPLTSGYAVGSGSSSVCALRMDANGNIWVANISYDSSTSVYLLTVQSVTISTFAVTGTYTYTLPFGFTISGVFNATLDPLGNFIVVLMNGSADPYTIVIPASSLSSGSYTGTVYIGQSNPGIEASQTLNADSDGNLIFYSAGSNYNYAQKLFRPNYYSATYVFSTRQNPTALPDYSTQPCRTYRYTMSKGIDTLYLMRYAPSVYNPNINTPLNNNLEIIAISTATGAITATYSFPEINWGTINLDGGVYGVYDQENGQFILFASGQNVYYTITIEPSITVTVHSTGQQLNFNFVNSLTAWLPLLAADNDTVTISGQGCTAQGALVNFDVVPYVLQT
jgi:hypothetical protein